MGFFLSFFFFSLSKTAVLTLPQAFKAVWLATLGTWLSSVTTVSLTTSTSESSSYDVTFSSVNSSYVFLGFVWPRTSHSCLPFLFILPGELLDLYFPLYILNYELATLVEAIPPFRLTIVDLFFFILFQIIFKI